MSARSIPMTWPVLILIGIVLLGAGVFGGQFLPNLLGASQESVQDFDAGDIDSRMDRVAPQEDTRPTPAAATGNGPADSAPTTADAPPPGADAQLDALMERIAADRQWREERRRLAADSPLTPGIEDMADLVRRGVQRRIQRDLPRRNAAGPTNPADIDPAGLAGPPGHDTLGRGTLSRQAAPQQAPYQAPTYLLAKGSVIPAMLQTPLDSDLPGLVRAQVSEDVRDSATGRHVLIPRGAQLVGSYGSDARTSQRRLFIAWTDLRLPGSEDTLALDRYATLGGDGASGVRGRRATGLLAALGAAVLFDLAGNATAILTGGDTASRNEEGDLGAIIAAATGNATGRVAERYLGDLLSRGPRFRVRAGTRMNVLIEADMRLPVWRGAP